ADLLGRDRFDHARLAALDLDRILDAPANSGDDNRALWSLFRLVRLAWDGGGRRWRLLLLGVGTCLVCGCLCPGDSRQHHERGTTSSGKEQCTARARRVIRQQTSPPQKPVGADARQAKLPTPYGSASILVRQ